MRADSSLQREDIRAPDPEQALNAAVFWNTHEGKV